MDPLLLGSIFNIGREILNRVFPDPQARAAAELELLKAQQEGAFRELDAELQRSLAQTNINAVEAASPSMFVSGWRPAVGWIGVSTLAYQYLLRPLLPWLLQAAGHPAPDMPALDNGMFELVMLMLGLGGMRSFEKLRKVS